MGVPPNEHGYETRFTPEGIKSRQRLQCPKAAATGMVVWERERRAPGQCQKCPRAQDVSSPRWKSPRDSNDRPPGLLRVNPAWATRQLVDTGRRYLQAKQLSRIKAWACTVPKSASTCFHVLSIVQIQQSTWTHAQLKPRCKCMSICFHARSSCTGIGHFAESELNT